MKKIAFILPGMGIGGVERSFLGLLRFAPKDEFDITLLLFSRGGELLVEIPEWVHIEYVLQAEGAEELRKGISSFLKKLRLHRVFAAAKAVYHALGPKLIGKAQQQKYDIAVAYNDGLASWYAAKSVTADTKIAFVHTDLKKAGYNAQTEYETYRNFDVIYFGSELSKEHFLELLPDCKAKCEVLPSCVDGDYVRKQADEQECVLPNDTVRLMTVGRLSHEKGMDKIPEILRLFKSERLPVKWYVIGDGIERENLLAQAKQLEVEDSMIFLGSKHNPYPYMAQCDIYVQPSNYEGYCIALAEARALFRPCVACCFSGADEQLRDGIDGFVTGMSASELYDKCKLLVENKQLREQFTKQMFEHGTLSQDRFCVWWKTLL